MKIRKEDMKELIREVITEASIEGDGWKDVLNDIYETIIDQEDQLAEIISLLEEAGMTKQMRLVEKASSLIDKGAGILRTIK